MSVVALALIGLLRIALPQAGHSSIGKAEVTDGVLHGSITYNTADWLAAISLWYGTEIQNAPKNNIEVYERNYFKNFFRVWADQIPVQYTTLERTEDQGQVTWSFSYQVGEAKEYMIDHRAIFDLYADQIHTMTLHVFGKEQNFAFKVATPTYFAKKREPSTFIKDPQRN